MLDPLFRRAVTIILIASVVLRLGYLIFGEILPVMWDARRYAAAGIGLISLVDSSGPDVTDERDDRYRFKHYYEKYIQGEQIEWLSYTPHSLTEAREEIFFSGPLYPFVLAIVFFLSPVADFTVARLLGIGFDVAANLLLILIGVRLVGRKGALIAGAIYAVYFPFILTSTLLLLETSTSLLILLAIYLLMRGQESGQRRPLILAGLVTGALVLNKPTAMLLGIPLLVGFYLYTRKDWNLRAFSRRALLFAAPAAAVFVFWLGIASMHYGQLALRDPKYAEANLLQSASVLYEGYDLDKVEDGFWGRSVAAEISSDPAGYAGLLIKKLDRLWRRPYNDFQRSFIIPWQAGEVLHLGMIVAGLIGLLLLFRANLNLAAWPVLIVGYYTALHLVFHSISRYSFQAIPMMMLAAGFLLVAAHDGLRASARTAAKGYALGLGCLVLGWLLEPQWINALIHTGLNEVLVGLTLAVRVGLIAVGLYLLFRPLAEHLRVNRFATPIVATTMLAVVVISNTFARDQWAEFSCRLDTDHMKTGTRIYISHLQPITPEDQFVIAVDLNSGAGRRNTFTMAIHDKVFEFVGGQPPLSKLFYPKPVYRYYGQLIPLGIEEFRQYAFLPIPDSVLQNTLTEHGFLDISVAINNEFPEPNNFVTLWGRLSASGDHYIPAWRNTAIERFVHQGDPRIPLPVNYLSDSAISYYIPRTSDFTRDCEDLSPSAGQQTGRYNIFLMQLKPDGQVLVY